MRTVKNRMVLTSGWALSFSVALLCIALSVTQSVASDADADLATDVFVQKQLGEATPAPSVLKVQGDDANMATQLLGSPYPSATAHYWRRGGRSLWILEARGKTHVFTTGFVVEDKKIVATEIIAYHGARGRGVLSKRFTRQFLGLNLKKGNRLSKRVHGITGATISSKAMINTARLALAWDATVGREKDESGGHE